MISSDPLLRAEDLCKSFGTRRAVDHVSMTVGSGGITALLGPNGGGKTTLFRMISSLLTPDRGSVQIAGLDSARDGLAYRRQLGVVFQSPSLDAKLTAVENLRHFGHLHALRSRPLTARITEMLERLDVADRAHDRVETLSGGLARRVELAKCMLTRPRLLLMDEPSTGLDPKARRTLWNCLDNLRRTENVTVLLTTHFLDEAERCDTVAVLDRGKLVALDPPQRLRANLGSEVISIETDEPQSLAPMLETDLGVKVSIMDHSLRIETDDPPRRLAVIAERLAGKARSITLSQPTLEDVFIHLTGHRFDS